jgi:hypothetical protein
MFKRSITLAALFVIAIILGCSAGAKKPGTGGTSSPQKLVTTHPDIPDGVKCYVCHKKEIPDKEFHKKFGANCEECHGKTTWVAYLYPHTAWNLGIHRKMQCARCHYKMNDYDFSAWQCWGCHHDKKATEDFHKSKGIDDVSNCIACHKGSKEQTDKK